MTCSITNKPISFEEESGDYLVFSPLAPSSVDYKICFVAQEAFESFGKQQSGVFSYLAIKNLSEDKRTFLQSNADKLNAVEIQSNELFKSIFAKMQESDFSPEPFLSIVAADLTGASLDPADLSGAASQEVNSLEADTLPWGSACPDTVSWGSYKRI